MAKTRTVTKYDIKRAKTRNRRWQYTINTYARVISNERKLYAQTTSINILKFSWNFNLYKCTV